MDSVDRVLVAALQDNARSTYAELARLVGLSAASVHERVRRLEESSAITGYTATVSASALGLGVCALISIYLTDSAECDDVADGLRAVAEIEDCWFVAGDEAFVIKVGVADVDALEHLLAVLWRIPGVARTRTTVVLSTRWERRRPPVPDHCEVVGTDRKGSRRAT
jgi:Lrp/AsnC family leucine-responsive transcriptional regulator